MDNKNLQLKGNQQQLSTVLNEKETEIAKAVWRLDMVKAFPFDVSELENWSRHIYRLCPYVTQERLYEIVDKYLTGEWIFDKDQGIANIIWHINNPSGGVWNNG